MLPAEIEYENSELLGDEDRDSYDFNANCTQIMDGVITIADGSIDEESLKDNVKVQNQYNLSEDAVILLKHSTYQYSPNGNIQKTTVRYEVVDIAVANAQIEKQESGFADIWLNEENMCDRIIITAFDK